MGALLTKSVTLEFSQDLALNPWVRCAFGDDYNLLPLCLTKYFHEYPALVFLISGQPIFLDLVSHWMQIAHLS